MIVKAQDLHVSYCKSINVTSPNNLTEPGFPDITDVDDETVWKKGTVLITADSILSGLWESKISKQRFIKVRYFAGARIRGMLFSLVPLLHKKPNKMILHIGTNDSTFYSATEIVEEIGKRKQYVLEQLPTVKLVISTPTLRTYKANANLINAEVTELLGTNEEKITITHPNIKEEHLDNYDLNINNIGKRNLAKSLLSVAQAI